MDASQDVRPGTASQEVRPGTAWSFETIPLDNDEGTCNVGPVQTDKTILSPGRFAFKFLGPNLNRKDERPAKRSAEIKVNARLKQNPAFDKSPKRFGFGRFLAGRAGKENRRR